MYIYHCNKQQSKVIFYEHENIFYCRSFRGIGHRLFFFVSAVQKDITVTANIDSTLELLQADIHPPARL